MVEIHWKELLICFTALNRSYKTAQFTSIEDILLPESSEEVDYLFAYHLMNTVILLAKTKSYI